MTPTNNLVPWEVQGFLYPCKNESDMLDEMLRVSLEDIERKIDVSEATLPQIYGHKTSVLRHYNFCREMLDQVEDAARRFFKSHPEARKLRDEVIPEFVRLYNVPLDEPGQDRYDDALNNLFGPEFAKEDLEYWQKKYERPLTTREKAGLILNKISFQDPEKGYSLLKVHGRTCATTLGYTLGIGRVISHGTWLITADTSLNFFELEILFPLFLVDNMGASDVGAGICWVNQIACNYEARRAFACAAGKLPSQPENEHLTTFASSYKTPESLAMAIMNSGLCEEVTHQCDFFRFKSGNHRFASQWKINFFLKNVRDGHWLWNLWEQCDNDHDRYRLAREVEEAHAKLFSIAIGPDPNLNIAWFAGILFKAVHRSRPFPADVEIVAAILNGTNTNWITMDTLNRFVKMEKPMLRLLAAEGIRETFVENLGDFKQWPFCRLDEKGELHRHSKTHPMMATWVEKTWKESLKSWLGF